MGSCSSPGSDVPAVGGGSHPLLTEFDGLDAVQYVPGFVIYGQEHLRSLAGLRELAEGGAYLGAAITIGINPELPDSEISVLAEAAGFTEVVACQNKDDMEICQCPSD